LVIVDFVSGEVRERCIIFLLLLLSSFSSLPSRTKPSDLPLVGHECTLHCTDWSSQPAGECEHTDLTGPLAALPVRGRGHSNRHGTAQLERNGSLTSTSINHLVSNWHNYGKGHPTVFRTQEFFAIPSPPPFLIFLSLFVSSR
jgi:hypothetical protein